MKKYLSWVADQKRNLNIILVLGLIVNIGCHIYHDVTGNSDVWFFGNAFTFFLLAIVIYNFIQNIITQIYLALTFQQLIDELINTPIDNPTVEYIGFIILLIVLIFKKYRSYKKNKGDD